MRKLYAICLTFALFCTVAYAAKKYPMTASSIVPGARAEVEVSKDKNGNTSLKMKVQHLAHLDNLTPRANAYVVWLQERGGNSENKGQLKMDKNLAATFETVTPFKSFDVNNLDGQAPEPTPDPQPPVDHPNLPHASFRPEKKNGHADTVLDSASCGA